MTKTIQTPRIEFSVFFNKQLTAAPREIRVAFLETLQLYRDDPNHPSLRNHALKDKYAALEVLMLLAIGAHYIAENMSESFLLSSELTISFTEKTLEERLN